MASAGMAPPTAVEKISGNSMLVDKLPEEINEMTIKDDKVEKVDSSTNLSGCLTFGIGVSLWKLLLKAVSCRKWRQLW